jgi:hypothetical protein
MAVALQTLLDAVDAAILGTLTREVAGYSVGGRRVDSFSLDELYVLKTNLERAVNRATAGPFKVARHQERLA